jgi:hypothetical protein
MPALTRTGPKKAPVDHPILFQKFFKSVGPRTYASQVKQASNGNHYLVLTEGRRVEGSDEVRKSRLFIYSEDFPAFFRMLHETAQWIRANPLSEEVKRKRDNYWNRRDRPAGRNGASSAMRRA